MIHVDSALQSPAVLSLCTGMRGLERGIERDIGPVRTVAYVEIEAFVIENLVRQMEQGVLAPAPVWSNLKTFPSEQLHGKIHGITGGYPCQPFSVAGGRKGTEDPRHLWPHIKRMVGAIRPVWCFFENVPGHLTLGYREVRSDLEQLGYTVEEGIFSAEEVGAPHQRKRLFILAVDHTRINGQQPEHQVSARRNSTEYAGEGDMADSTEQRMEGDWSEGKPITEVQTGEEVSGCYGGRDRWPARPGEQQYEWEAPRIESSLGLTVNGYNFREDLLRMAGNGVVEQTAELAWITLWDKIKKGHRFR